MLKISALSEVRASWRLHGGVAKSVDAVDSKSTVEIRAGSSPAFGTKNDCDNRKTYNNQYVVQ
ncbi:MAG: hypothetical protein E7G78_10275 [Escherichia coli]|nr:hypothetical protein [Escherichia coli]